MTIGQTETLSAAREAYCLIEWLIKKIFFLNKIGMAQVKLPLAA
jgi:hypothetical protein